MANPQAVLKLPRAYDDVHVSIELVNPAKAAEWLSRNVQNRKISRGLVDYLRRAMEAGKWRLNGQAFIFTPDGKMLDGQHRCMSVMESGVTIRSVVVRGIAEDVFTTIDVGLKRTASQALQILGVAYPHMTAAAASLYYRFERGNISYAFSHAEKTMRVHPSDVVELVERCPGLAEAAKKMAGLSRLARFSNSPSACAVSYFLGSDKHGEAVADGFFEPLNSGAGLPKSSPILCLRNMLQDLHHQKHRPPQAMVFGLVVQAWNAYIDNRQMRVLRPWNWNRGMIEVA